MKLLIEIIMALLALGTVFAWRGSAGRPQGAGRTTYRAVAWICGALFIWFLAAVILDGR